MSAASVHNRVMARSQEVVTVSGAVVQRVPRAGDMRWDQVEWQRWNGARWVRAVYSLRPDRLRNPAHFADEDVVDEPRRQRALALAVEDQVVTNAATVVHEGPTGVVLGYVQRTSYSGHVMMSVLTVGLWLPILMAAMNRRREQRVSLQVDRYGNVWATLVAGE